MSMKTMTATDAMRQFGSYLDAAQREPVMITKKNRPVAVTLSIQDAEELLSYRVDAGIKKGLADVEAGRFNELTTEYAEGMKARFKASLA